MMNNVRRLLGMVMKNQNTRQLFKMFGKKQNNRNGALMAAFGLGTVLTLITTRGNKVVRPIQSGVKNMMNKRQMPALAANMEIAKEFLSNEQTNNNQDQEPKKSENQNSPQF